MAALLGFLAGLTRPEGIMIAIPLLLMGVERKRGAYLAAAAVVASALPAFMAFAYTKTGDFLAPLVAEAGWKKAPLLSILGLLHAGPGVFLPVAINIAVMTLAAVFAVRYFGRAWRDRRLFPYFAWAALVLLVTVLLSDARSWARLTILVFPVLWVQAQYGSEGKWRFGALLVAYAALLCASTVLFSDWYPML